MPISVSTLLGLFTGIILITAAISTTTDNYSIFISASSALVVLGGTISATFLSYHFVDILRTFKDCWHTIVPSEKPIDLQQDITQLVSWAQEVQTHGVSHFEAKLDELSHKDEFTYYALNLLSDQYNTTDLMEVLENFIISRYERDNISVDILSSMSVFAPAFGMIGTLIGLIVMLDGLGGDPAKLGAGLAVALNTTFYGVIVANLFCKPWSNKVKMNNQLLRDRNLLLAEGFVLIANNTDPLVIQGKLNSFVELNQQHDMFSD
jgi:chemotaxis protein MotA